MNKNRCWITEHQKKQHRSIKYLILAGPGAESKVLQTMKNLVNKAFCFIETQLYIYIIYRTSLLIQWLRLCLPMHRVWVQSLIGELRFHMPSGQKKKIYIYIYIYIHIQNWSEYTHTHTHVYILGNDPRTSICPQAQNMFKHWTGRNFTCVSAISMATSYCWLLLSFLLSTPPLFLCLSFLFYSPSFPPLFSPSPSSFTRENPHHQKSYYIRK